MAKADITGQMKDILQDYTKEVKRATNNALDIVAKECVQKLKNTSPKRAGRGKHYANGWAVKRARGLVGINQVVVHNKTKPQLTHLLENGHVVDNGKGTYGRTRGIKHIAPVEEYAADELPKQIERELE